jgi:hypothetical protein
MSNIPNNNSEQSVQEIVYIIKNKFKEIFTDIENSTQNLKNFYSFDKNVHDLFMNKVEKDSSLYINKNKVFEIKDLYISLKSVFRLKYPESEIKDALIYQNNIDIMESDDVYKNIIKYTVNLFNSESFF